jgi:flavin-binding protein dodecin
LNSTKAYAAESVRRFLAENPQARRKAINWKVVPLTSTTPESWVKFVEGAVGRAWDGVRRLPFTDEVAAALAITVILACVDISETPSYRIQDFTGVLGPIIPMELANAQNVAARAAMANATYERALRPDLNEVLAPELLDGPREQLRQVLSPSHLFDFSQLVDAFARELIPTQVLVQRPDLAVFFSPTQVSVIGAP